MITEFNQLNLNSGLLQAVSEQNYNNPTPIQAEVIPLILAGEDVIGQAQTGTGKTAAFALPMIQLLNPDQRTPQGLILTPTRELALQVAGSLQGYSKHQEARVLAVYGGQAYGPQINQLRRGVDIIVGTPGRLIDLLNKDVLDLSGIRTLVLDEADEMLSMGFVEDIETILATTPANRQTALFSATLPKEIRRLAEKYMHDPKQVSIKREQVTVDAITQKYYLVNNSEKIGALTRLFEVEEITSALIFVRTRVETADLANELSLRGYPAEALSGDLSQEARERTLNRFRQNQIKVVVATDVAARGLDIDDISHVFNYHLPEDPEIYVHRIGRTGRAGKTGTAISLVSPGEKRRLGQVESFTRKKIQQAVVPNEESIRVFREEQLMKKVAMWLKRGRCIREKELVMKMVEEGFDPVDIAAAALKVARAEEKQRPIHPVQEIVKTFSPRSDSGKRADAVRSGSRMQISEALHEPGMARLRIGLGRVQGLKPGEVVGIIASHANIPGSVIGRIQIQDNRSYVDVPTELVSQVIAGTKNIQIRSVRMDMQVA